MSDDNKNYVNGVVWKDYTAGDSVEGILVDILENMGKFGNRLYKIRTDDAFVAVWGSNDLDKKMAFIYEKDAGDFIAYLADHFVQGAISGCSKEAVKISDIVEYIEKGLGKKAVISQQGDDAPYNGIEDTLSFSTEKAESTGYRFRELNEWLYPLIDARIKDI